MFQRPRHPYTTALLSAVPPCQDSRRASEFACPVNRPAPPTSRLDVPSTRVAGKPRTSAAPRSPSWRAAGRRPGGLPLSRVTANGPAARPSRHRHRRRRLCTASDRAIALAYAEHGCPRGRRRRQRPSSRSRTKSERTAGKRSRSPVTCRFPAMSSAWCSAPKPSLAPSTSCATTPASSAAGNLHEITLEGLETARSRSTSRGCFSARKSWPRA